MLTLYLPIQGFTEAICPYVPLSHPEAIEEAGPGSRYIAGVTATRAPNTRYIYYGLTMAMLWLCSLTVAGDQLDLRERHARPLRRYRGLLLGGGDLIRRSHCAAQDQGAGS